MLGGLLLLYLGGEGVVRGSVSLGLKMGITPLLTGLTIVAFGTSAPELMVSLQAALRGEDGLAIGNVVGSNICNIGLVLGLTVLVRPIFVDSKLVRRDVPIMLACAFVLLALLIDFELSRLDGAILAMGLLAHIVFTVRTSRVAKWGVRTEFREAVPGRQLTVGAGLLFAVLGLATLLWGGSVFVQGAMGFSEELQVSPALIGLSVAAIGTSLPELATSTVAAARGYGDLAAGNIVGSNIFNTLSVLGITSLTTPLDRGAVTPVDLAVMIMASLLTLRLMVTRSVMERWEGGLLLAGFAGYMAWLLVQAG
jgi:cation:H+ antiporter